MAHAHAARERRGGDAPRRDRQADDPKEREASGGAHYLKDVRSSTSQMRRPPDGSSLSWRWAATNFSDPRRHCPCSFDVLERSAVYSKAHWTYLWSLKAGHSIFAMLDVLKCKNPGCRPQRCVLCAYIQHGTDCCDCEMFKWLSLVTGGGRIGEAAGRMAAAEETISRAHQAGTAGNITGGTGRTPVGAGAAVPPAVAASGGGTRSAGRRTRPCCAVRPPR